MGRRMLTVRMTVPHAKLDRWKAALADVQVPLERIGKRVSNFQMVDYFSSSGDGTWPPVPRDGGADKPLLDKGAQDGLVSKFTYAVGERAVVVTNLAKYAAIQNFGGTVNAKNAFKGIPGGPYLSIPLPGLSVTQRRHGPRAFAGKKTFVAKSRNNNWIMFEKVSVASGKRKGQQAKAKSKFASRWSPGTTAAEQEDVIRPLFILKKSVSIKARRFMLITDSTRTWCRKIGMGWMTEVLA